jgi:hypothetical protein
LSLFLQLLLLVLLELLLTGGMETGSGLWWLHYR